MASKAFQETLKTFKEWLESMELTGDHFDLQALRYAINNTTIPVPETTKIYKVDMGRIPAEWIIEPGSRSDFRLAYFHGGGYVAGGLKSHRPLAAWISKASGCSVLLIDYRLAPENPFPAAVDDALSSFKWMRENGPYEQKVASKTFIAGDSAGGGLTLATLIALRDHGDSLPDAAVTVSAFTDLALTGDSLKSKAEIDPLVNPAILPSYVELYLAGTDPYTPLASPLYGDLTSFPPLLIQVGENEVLLDDSTRFAEKAKSAGVDVKLEIWPDMFHAWQLFAPFFPEAQQAIDRIGEFICSF